MSTQGHIDWTLGGKDSSFHMGPRSQLRVAARRHAAPERTADALRRRLRAPLRSPSPRPRCYASIRVPHRLAGDAVHALAARHCRGSRAARSYSTTTTCSSAGGRLGLLRVHRRRSPDLQRQLRRSGQHIPGVPLRVGGRPRTPGALAVSPGPNGAVTVYASWNGATGVAAWRVLGGGTPRHPRRRRERQEEWL